MSFINKFKFSLTIIPIFILINDNVFSLIIIPENVFPNNDKISIAMVNRFNRSKVINGDIIIINSPLDTNKKLILEVKACQGELIKIKENNHLSVRSIPDGYCWLGIQNNQQKEIQDSRHFGATNLGLIEGKISFIIYPFFKRTTTTTTTN
jgi:hypothetical protein